MPTGATDLAAHMADPPIRTARNPEVDQEKERIREYSLKAAFLHHFFKYTTWPEKVDTKNPPPFELWVVGDDPFGELLDKTFKDKVIQGRTIRITRKKEVPEELDAHLVFAGGLDDDELEDLLELCAKKPALLIGELDGLAARGADANFYIEDSRVHFEINTDAVKASGLTISSELLKLARIVKPKKKRGKSS
jgi:hypothetical protein